MTGIIIFVIITAVFIFMFDTSGWTEEDEEHDCPFCESSDTDGNHCNECGEDY